jgi:hypothetical protein
VSRSGPDAEAHGTVRRRAVAIVVATVFARLSVAGVRRLSPDEALYACAARAGWPLPDHPPALGALLSVADRFPGATELRVRIVAIVLQAATAFGIGAVAREVVGDGDDRDGRSAEGFAIVLSTIGLLPWVSGLIATPDAPLLAATAWLIALATRDAAASRHAVGRAIAIAALSAAAVASKVVGIGIVAIVAVGLARRRRILAAGAATFGAIAAIATIPSIVVSLGLQSSHAVGRGPLVSAPLLGAPRALLAFAAGALALIGPAALVAAHRGRRALGGIVGGRLLVGGLVAALILSALVSGRPPEANWIAPALIPLLAIGGVGLAQAGGRTRALVTLGHAAPAALGLALFASAAPVTLLARVAPAAAAPPTEHPRCMEFRALRR